MRTNKFRVLLQIFQMIKVLVMICTDLLSSLGTLPHNEHNRSTYTASLASSVSNYQYENGRRYNGYRRGSKFPFEFEQFSIILTLQTISSQTIRHVAVPITNSFQMLMGMQQEIDRLHLQHHMISILFGGRLHWAPINPNPQNILDIGTGTGSWAVDIADMYPSAHVCAP